MTQIPKIPLTKKLTITILDTKMAQNDSIELFGTNK